MGETVVRAIILGMAVSERNARLNPTGELSTLTCVWRRVLQIKRFYTHVRGLQSRFAIVRLPVDSAVGMVGERNRLCYFFCSCKCV